MSGGERSSSKAQEQEGQGSNQLCPTVHTWVAKIYPAWPFCRGGARAEASNLREMEAVPVSQGLGLAGPGLGPISLR